MPASLRVPFVAAVLATLALTLVRLFGELQDGPGWLFGKDAGGGGAAFGIGWLIPFVGAWFGRRLAGGVAPPPLPRARALAVSGLGLLGVAVVFTLAKVVLGVTFGTFLFVAIALPVLMIAVWHAWPALARALFVYALAARIPILVITGLAVAGDWGTHYERLAPGSPAMGALPRTLILCAAQVCLWIPLTVMIGCCGGLLAAGRPSPTGSRTPGFRAHT